jgi:flavodoxin
MCPKSGARRRRHKKTLVAYYSRTGHTRVVAQAVASGLGADILEIPDAAGQAQRLDHAEPGADGSVTPESPGEAVLRNLTSYDLVIVGTPIRTMTVSSPVRAWLAEHGRLLQNVAFFCTMAGIGKARAFRDMERLCGRKPLATLALIDTTVLAGKHVAAVEEFVKQLQVVPVAP